VAPWFGYPEGVEKPPIEPFIGHKRHEDPPADWVDPLDIWEEENRPKPGDPIAAKSVPAPDPTAFVKAIYPQPAEPSMSDLAGKSHSNTV
jgi:hypothetical protein